MLHGEERVRKMSETHLLVSNEDPVNLDGSLDAAGELQLVHGTDSLADYCQVLWAEHADLATAGETIQIRLVDFTSGGSTWELSASHLDASQNPVTWSQSSTYAHYDFEAMDEELEVDVTATSDGSPPVTKTRKIRIKTKPEDGQPDRPH